MPGTQPTVETVVWRCETPRSGRRSHAASAGLVAQPQARERHLARERLAQRARQVGHLAVVACPARSPGPDLARAKTRLVRERAIKQLDVHAIHSWRCDWPSTSPTPASP